MFEQVYQDYGLRFVKSVNMASKLLMLSPWFDYD